jgi:uncharacterized protein YukE
MNPLTDQELENLLDDIESDRAERKESWAGSAFSVHRYQTQ